MPAVNKIDRPTLEQRADAVFAAYVGQQVPGCAVGVARDGEVLLAKGYGRASIEHDVAIDADTAFRIASVSKQFTVVAVLLLAAEGRLALADDVHRHIPELPPLAAKVTLDHLARNTSGLPDMLELLRLGGVSMDFPISRARLLQTIVRCAHLNFAPGSRFLYCNSNFLLLGLIVERVSGMGLGAFLRKNVFAPLGMPRTTMLVEADRPWPRLATPYLADPADGYRRALHGVEHGGEGGLVSTVNDLLVWAREFEAPKMLPREIVQQLTAPTTLSDGHASMYARGVEHGRWRGLATVGHGGLWPGYRTEFLRVPDAGLAVVVIGNFGGVDPYRLARDVVALVLAGDARLAPAVEPDAGSLARLAGTWLNAEEPSLFELAVQGNQLVVTQWGTPFTLAPQVDGSFVPLRGAYEFRLRVIDAEHLAVDVGAGRSLAYARLRERSAPAVDLAGTFTCEHVGARWVIEPAPGDNALRVRVDGPYWRDAGPWQASGVADDLVEIQGESYWLRLAFLARIERDAAGNAASLVVDTARVRGLRFTRA